MDTDEDLYHALPQTMGKISHESVEDKRYSTKKSDVMALSVVSERLGVVGKIDLYKSDRKLLIERKYRMKNIFRGQLYQLWAEYYCMVEQGYEVIHLAFYEISTNKMIPVSVPGPLEEMELISVLSDYRNYYPGAPLNISHNKCLHCIYSNLCDKMTEDNVYA